MLLPILIILSMLSVVAVLMLGLFSMAKGGEFNEKYGNKLMQARVVLQTITIILLGLSYYLAQS